MSNRLKTLALVFSPLQFLNVISYSEQFNEEIIIYIASTSEINTKQIRILDKYNIGNYYFRHFKFLCNEFKLLLAYLHFIIFLRISEYDRIIIGNYNNILGYSLSLRFHNQGKPVLLVDDGLASIRVFVDRNVRSILDNPNIFGGKIIILFKIVNKILFKNQINSLSFYTTYNLEQFCKRNIDSIKLQKISAKAKSITNSELWFIGSPLIENSIISENALSTIINQLKIFASYNNLTLIYILHRAENMREFGVESRKFDLPIEIELANNEIIPAGFVTCFSTAIVNIASQFFNASCYYIDIRSFSSKKSELNDVYSFLESHNRLNKLELTPNI